MHVKLEDGVRERDNERLTCVVKVAISDVKQEGKYSHQNLHPQGIWSLYLNTNVFTFKL